MRRPAVEKWEQRPEESSKIQKTKISPLQEQAAIPIKERLPYSVALEVFDLNR
jgi:hypothetical protein